MNRLRQFFYGLFPLNAPPVAALVQNPAVAMEERERSPDIGGSAEVSQQPTPHAHAHPQPQPQSPVADGTAPSGTGNVGNNEEVLRRPFSTPFKHRSTGGKRLRRIQTRGNIPAAVASGTQGKPLNYFQTSAERRRKTRERMEKKRRLDPVPAMFQPAKRRRWIVSEAVGEAASVPAQQSAEGCTLLFSRVHFPYVPPKRAPDGTPLRTTERQIVVPADAGGKVPWVFYGCGTLRANFYEV